MQLTEEFLRGKGFSPSWIQRIMRGKGRDHSYYYKYKESLDPADIVLLFSEWAETEEGVIFWLHTFNNLDNDPVKFLEENQDFEKYLSSYNREYSTQGETDDGHGF